MIGACMVPDERHSPLLDGSEAESAVSSKDQERRRFTSKHIPEPGFSIVQGWVRSIGDVRMD